MKKFLLSLLMAALLMSNMISGVEAKAAPIQIERSTATPTSNVITYLPDELLADNPVNPAKSLEAFLNTCSNKKVVFPSNKTFVLEKQLVIHGVKNLEIDFNECTIKLPNGCTWKTRYDTGYSVGTNAITIHNSSNITFKNYLIDGNSSKIATEKWCTGLWLYNTNGFTSYNGAFINCNYHQIVIYGGTKEISFTETYFKDHGGAALPAGISDVYVENNSDDSFSFYNTTVDNTALKDRQGQCFYINGYNGIFDTVYANNCSIPLDVRKGTHIAKNFTVINAEQVLMVQPYPNKSTEFANLTASNFTGINIKGNNSGAAGLYIVGCESCHLDNFKISMDPASTYTWYAIRIRDYYHDYPLSDVVITNSEVSNFTNAGFSLETLADSVTIKDTKATGISNSNTKFGVKSTLCTTEQYVENFTSDNCTSYNSIDGMIQIKH